MALELLFVRLTEIIRLNESISFFSLFDELDFNNIEAEEIYKMYKKAYKYLCVLSVTSLLKS